jgi:hypothetical protein
VNRRTKAEIHREKELIINYIEEQGKVTARQTFYYLVSNNIVPSSKSSYKMVDDLVNYLRYKGLIPFDSILDSTSLIKTQQWKSFKEMLECTKNCYRSNWNEEFDTYLEVWIEKEALSEIVSRVADQFGIYTSVSQGVSKISQIDSFLKRALYYNKPTIILYLGDFDPTGLHIDQVVIPDQIKKEISIPDFNNKNIPKINIRRLAVTEEQTKRLPENYQIAKSKDPNYKRYREKYGTRTWELDALSTKELEVIVSNAIEWFRPMSRIEELINRDEEEVKVLAT